MNRNTWLGVSLALVNILLYAYLVSHLNWSGPIVFAVSSLFLATSTFYLAWNLGYAYAIHRKSKHQEIEGLRPISGEYPSIDIIVPAYRESSKVLDSMLKGFLQLDYPSERLRLYPCDDTEDAEAKKEALELCWSVGEGRIEYPQRDHRRGFKGVCDPCLKTF